MVDRWLRTFDTSAFFGLIMFPKLDAVNLSCLSLNQSLLDEQEDILYPHASIWAVEVPQGHFL